MEGEAAIEQGIFFEEFADQVEEALKVDLVDHVVALHPRLHLPHPITPGQLARLLLFIVCSAYLY